MALSRLAGLPELAELDLSVKDNHISWVGVTHLCRLGDAARLHTLRLAFCGNRVGDIGVVAGHHSTIIL